jgi:hypothetical protein
MARSASKTPADELTEIIRVGFWRLQAEKAPHLVALAGRTFGDDDSTSALRRRLRRGLGTLSPEYSDAAFILFGVTDDAAGRNLGERQTIAGETEHLPGGQQAKSTVRGQGGLQGFLVARILSYFEDGPAFPEIDPTAGRGYSNLAYHAHCKIDPSAPLLWDIDLWFSVAAYRSDVDIVVTGLQTRRADMDSVDVLSQGHHKIGVVSRTPTRDDSRLLLAIYLETPLARGVPTEFHVREVGLHDGTDKEVAVGTAVVAAPRTDPGVRYYRTGLLPWVLASKRALGQGCRTRTVGSHRVSRRCIRAQVILERWLRRRSALSQYLTIW